MTEELKYYFADAPTIRISRAIAAHKDTQAISKLVQRAGEVRFVYVLANDTVLAFNRMYGTPDLTFPQREEVASYTDAAVFQLGTPKFCLSPMFTAKILPERLAVQEIPFKTARKIAVMFSKIFGFHSYIPTTPTEYAAYIAEAEVRIVSNHLPQTNSAPSREAGQGGAPGGVSRANWVPVVG